MHIIATLDPRPIGSDIGGWLIKECATREQFLAQQSPHTQISDDLKYFYGLDYRPEDFLLSRMVHG